ncbi:MAG TPA: cytochrome c family protein [Sphingomicrobium sp.]|jgi:cytochrome c|nr:cytochrome c family protein [Sphingomicrobium sp.]
MDDRFNTIAGWVLFAGIIGLGGSVIVGELFHSEAPEQEGYAIEGAQEGAGGAAEAEKPIEFYLASADPTKGADVFKKCAACHNADKGGANQLGPNLWGVVGAPIGEGRGFAWSDALGKHGGTWDWDSLSKWLTSPKTFAPGTKMTFAGLSKPEDRANVIAFLNQHSDSPKPMPAPPAAPAGSPTAGGDAGNAAAATPGDIPGQKAQKEPVLNNTAADQKGGGEAAPQK